MSASFDPYREWLGLHQPSPNHYQLLGLPEYEQDAARIAAAADARMALVRTYQTGPRGRYTQQILNEIAAAKLCLIDPQTRAAYDSQLMWQRQRAALAAPPISPPPVPALRSFSPPEAADETVEAEEEIVAAAVSRWWLPIGVAVGLLLLVVLMVGVVLGRRLANQPPAEIVKPTPEQNQTPAEVVEVVPPVPPPDPHRVALEANGDLYLLPATAEMHGGVQGPEPGQDAGLTNWQGADAAARWRFALEKPAIFQVQLEYSAQGTAEAQWEMMVGDEPVKRREVLTSEAGQADFIDEFYWKVGQSGEHELALRAVGLPEGAKLTLKSLRLFRQKAGRVR